MRKCNRCEQILPLSKYHRDKQLHCGYRYTCKCCANTAAKRSRIRSYVRTNGLISTYRSMKSRCYNRKHNSFARYGGRGITVCDQWLISFESFRRWAEENGRRNGLQIDRINNDGPYAPENCRWVVPAINVRNREATKLTDQKVSQIRDLLNLGKPQAEIANQFGVDQSLISTIRTGKIWKDVP